MRFIYLILTLALIAAVGAPFFLKGPDGQPLLSLDRLLQDSTPQAMKTSQTVYRWKDAQGVWQFGDEPPPGVQAEVVEIRENITPIKATWAAELEALEAASATENQIGPNVKILHEAYDGKALEKAEDAAGLVGNHSEQLEELLKLAQPKE